jgi:hypothetical protein
MAWIEAAEKVLRAQAAQRANPRPTAVAKA